MTPFSDEKGERPHFSDEEIAFAKKTFPKWGRIHALLARLEAAEKVMAFAEFDHKKCRIKTCDFDRAFKAWRKSAGK